eukprot:scaffold2012_cov193-Cylindrotheca_fusiformis.AAC.9
MPALRLCGSRTLVSGDELRFYSVTSSFGRLVQLSVGIALTVVTVRQTTYNEDLRSALQECENIDESDPFHSHRLFILLGYAIISIVLAVVSLCTSIPIYLVTSRGTPTDPTPRKNMPMLCYINLSVVSFLRLLAFIFGILSMTLVFDFCECISEQEDIDAFEEWKGTCSQHNSWFALLIASLIFHGLDVSVCGAFLTYILCTKPLNKRLASEWNWASYLKCCVTCTSTMTCCIFGGTNAVGSDFADISFLLANFFNHNQILDVTPSDVAAGLIMVRRAAKVETMHRRMSLSQSKQLSYRIENKRILLLQRSASLSDLHHQQSFSLITDPADEYTASSENRSERTSSDLARYIPETREGREILSKTHQRDRYMIAEGARFSPYAKASYGWFAVLLEHPCRGLCNLGWQVIRRVLCLRSSSHGKYHDDTCLKLHRVSLHALSSHFLDEDNIVYASFTHSVEATPYMIALDHTWKTVVVSIRGTVSFESFLSDITLNPVEMVSVGEQCGFNGKERFCHRGMLACAQWIYDDLKRHGKLESLLGSDGSCRGYRLRIVGHSLGAGIAAILSVMMRARHPNLRCLSFSPPGCVFSKNLAEESCSWITSYAVDSDLIPRISKESVEALRNDVLEMIARIKVPKHQVFDLPSFKKAKHSEASLRDENDSILRSTDEIESSRFRQQLQDYYAFQAELKRTNASKYIQLFLPGEVIQLFGEGRRTVFQSESSSEGTEHRKNTYTARFAPRKDFERIILSSHLMWDHDPVKVARRLQEVASDFGLNPPYTVYEQNNSSQKQNTGRQREIDEEVMSF